MTRLVRPLRPIAMNLSRSPRVSPPVSHLGGFALALVAASAIAMSLAGCPRSSVPASPAPPSPAAGSAGDVAPAETPPPAPHQGTLWLLADVRGTPRTCGCAKALELGGFDRLIPWLDAAWARDHGEGLLLHAGPLFFPEAAPPPDLLESHRRKAQLVSRLVGRLTRRLQARAARPEHPVGAAGVSSLDLTAAGADYAALAKTTGLPLLTANVTRPDGTLAFPAHRVLPTASGPTALRVGVFALTAPPPAGRPGPPGLRVTDPVAAARAQVAALRARADVDVVVLLSDLGLRQTKRLLRQVPGVDLALVGGLGEHPVVSEEADRVGDAYVVSLHREGRWVGQVTVHRTVAGPLALRGPGSTGEARRDADRPASWLLYRAVPLRWSLPQDPDVAAEMARFDAALQELARARAEASQLPTPKPGEAVYVGQERCLACHDEATPFARTNPHAQAWRTLQDGGKTFDPDCVACHVTGYGRPGGALVGRTAGREAVQCEACHGPGSRHVAAAEAGDEAAARRAIQGKPGAQACGLCHTRHHSPGFDFDAYRAKLLVPGHGRP